MSSAFLKKISKEFLGYLEKDLRKPLNRLAGQLYIVDKTVFMMSMEEILVDIYEENYELLDDETFGKLEAIKEEVFNYHKQLAITSGERLDSERQRDINALIERLVSTDGYPLPSSTIFYIPVRSYNRVQRIKTASGAKFAELLNKRLNLSEKKADKAKALGGSDKERGIHLGHGELGIAVSAAKGKQLLRILESKLARTRSEANKKLLQDVYSRVLEYDDTFKASVHLEKEQIFDTKGRLKGSFIAIISTQLSQANLLDAVTEGKSYESLRQYFKKELLDIKGSESLKEALKKVNAAIFTNVKRRKGVKVTSKIQPKKVIKTKSNAKSAKSVKRKTKGSVLAEAGIKARGIKIPKIAEKEILPNFLSLKALINSKLPAVVRKNMIAPGLINRTGRFAASAQVTDIVATTNGFPSIGYTYQKFPYQTFEPGYAKGNYDRDPRRVIDRSIREIAKDILTGRFFTRSV